MKVEILRYTERPLDEIGEMASTCYDTKFKDDEHAMRIGKHCINSGHGRNLEFARIIIKVTCSARVGRELYTHIAGAPTRLQASTRYITYDNFNYFTPEFDDPKIEEEYHKVMGVIRDFYKTMKDNGIENDRTGYILPLAMETTIVLSTNARMLENMFNQRLCYRALDEFRQLMRMLKKEIGQLDDQWKWISDKLFVPKCVKEGVCHENNKKCPLWEKYKPTK